MQLWPFMSHSGFLLESRFSDFFKFAIFSTKISLFLQIHFNLHEDKHSFGYFWTPKSTYDICSVFLYMLSYTLSPKNSKIEILFCQNLRPECTVLYNSNLEIHGFWSKALQIHGFLKKKIHLVHKPHEVRFWAAWFFSGTKNRASQGLAVLLFWTGLL